MKIVYDPNSLCHYGVMGMKWGRRKSKAKSSGKKASKSSKKTKYLTDSRKQKIKTVAKTAAKIAGGVAAASILGYAGSVAFNEISNALSTSNVSNLHTSEAPKEFSKEVVRSKPDNIVNETVKLHKTSPASRTFDKVNSALFDAMVGPSSAGKSYDQAYREWLYEYGRK